MSNAPTIFRLDDPDNRKMPSYGYPPIISREGEVARLCRYMARRQSPGWEVTDGQDEQPTYWVIPDDEMAENWRALDEAALARIFEDADVRS